MISLASRAAELAPPADLPQSAVSPERGLFDLIDENAGGCRQRLPRSWQNVDPTRNERRVRGVALDVLDQGEVVGDERFGIRLVEP